MKTSGTNNESPGSLGEELPYVTECFRKERNLSWAFQEGKN